MNGALDVLKRWGAMSGDHGDWCDNCCAVGTAETASEAAA